MDISLGALTYHHFNSTHTHKFEKCIGNCQLIANPIVDLRFGKDHLFFGANSLAYPMAGYRRDFPINEFSSLVAGGYYQNNGKYEDRGIKSNLMLGDVVPLAGVELVYKKFGILLTYPISVAYYRF